MKRKLSLMILNRNEEMYRDEMDKVRAGLSLCVGGSGCACGCVYEDQGGSNTFDNGCANDDGGLHSPGYSYSSSNIRIRVSLTCE